MFGGKSTALAKILQFARFHFPAWTLSISTFSIWAIHSAWIATGAIAGVIITIKVVETLLVYGTIVDPFLPYESILPGNNVSVLSSYHCSSNQSRINGQLDKSRFSCAIFPQDGFFDTIHIEGRNVQITELTFYANDIRVGDLMLHWKPITRPLIAAGAINWNTGAYSIEVMGRDTHYERRIRIFTVRALSLKLY